MKWSLPINKNIAGTLRAWRSEIISNFLVSENVFAFGDFDPQINWNGMAATGVIVYRARRLRIFNLMLFSVDIAATLAAPFTNVVTINLPGTALLAAVEGAEDFQGGAGLSNNAGVGEGCLWQIKANESSLFVYRPTINNYTAGLMRARINGFIEVS